MKVRVTFRVDDELRRAMDRRYGRGRLPTRDEIETNISSIVESVWEDYLYEYRNDKARPRDEDEEE